WVWARKGGEARLPLVPGLGLGGGGGRAEGHPGARLDGAAGGFGLFVDGGALLGGLGQRLDPQAEAVGLRPADPVGLGRGTAARDRDAAVHRAQLGDEIVQPVVGCGVAPLLRLGPRAEQDVDELPTGPGPFRACSASVPPEMMCTTARPRLRWSSVLSACAAATGWMMLGRRATISLMLEVIWLSASATPKELNPLEP